MSLFLYGDQSRARQQLATRRRQAFSTRALQPVGADLREVAVCVAQTVNTFSFALNSRTDEGLDAKSEFVDIAQMQEDALFRRSLQGGLIKSCYGYLTLQPYGCAVATDTGLPASVSSSAART